ncbi:MAG TPA: AAA family ATPase [Methanomassiliicoccales archaeon]|nr:AAA family ATPase [Methanomassiliicoccales archaeon]
MKSLFMGSVVERSGKSMVTLGVALNCPKHIGYFKPFVENLITGREALVDQDAYLMKKALKLKAKEEDLCPFMYDLTRPVSMERIVEAYHRVSHDSEMMIVEGTRDIVTGCLHGVSGMAIAKAVGAEVVLVTTGTSSALDKTSMLSGMMKAQGIPFKGAVINMCSEPDIRAALEEKGIPVLGMLPEVRELKRFTARDIADVVNAEIVVEDGLSNIVNEVLVGAMTPETALTTMRRVQRKALITGGDRADLQLAALTTDTSCLVLTGGLPPVKQVVAKAYEEGVPILVTRYNTLETAEMIDHLIARIDPSDTAKVNKIKELVGLNVDLKALWA